MSSKRMSTKRGSAVTDKRNSKSAENMYARTSIQLFKPSIKIKASWTDYYTAKYQQLWDSLYLSILEKETKSKMPSTLPETEEFIGIMPQKKNKTKPRNSNKKIHKKKKSGIETHRQSDSSARWSITAVPKKGNFPYLLQEICKSVQFGIMNIKQGRNSKGKESDILSFYFTISFQTNYKSKWFLYLKYMFDDVVSQKSDSEVRIKRCQITCDFSYGEINRIINKMSSKKFEVNVTLPSNVLIEIFSYVRPTKFLALYSSVIKESEDDFDSVEMSKFDKKNFNLSNTEWVCNFFGLETWHFMKLFKILMKFLEEKDVTDYVQKEKDYNKKWDEWREAQQDLNVMYEDDSD